MSSAEDVRIPPRPADRKLDPRAVALWQTENALGWILTLVVAFLLFHAPFVPAAWDPWVVAAAIGLTLASVVDALVLIPRRYRYFSYRLGLDGVVVEQGRLWRRRQVYPLARILYCETRQGPMLRLFGLFTVRAATIVDTRVIGPLSAAEAREVEQFILEYSA